MEQKIATLLLDCLHQDGSRISTGRFAALTHAEWQSLLTMAGEQKVGALFYHRLRSRGWTPLVPAEILSALQSVYRRNAVKNLRLQGELNRIVTALHAGNIPLIVLKGAYLASVVYEHPALREMVDLDLLVPANDLGPAAAILEAQGYKPLRPYALDLERSTVQQLPLLIKPQMTSIELHWNIPKPDSTCCIDPAELWDRAVPARLAGVDVLGLCAEDLLLHLCFHTSYKHCFEFGLRPSCDMAEVIRRYGETLAWPQLAQRARRWGWERGVYLALRLAQELVGAAAPDVALHDLRPAVFDETLITTARMQVFTDRKLASSMSHNFVMLWRGPGLKEKIGEFWRSLFLPKAIIAKRYAVSPDSLKVYLYYPVRLKDMLLRNWRVTLKLYRGDPTLSPVAQRKAVLQEWLAE